MTIPPPCYCHTSRTSLCSLTPPAHVNSSRHRFSRLPAFPPSICQTQRCLCVRMAAQKPEVQPYTYNNREAVKSITAHFITMKKKGKKSPQGSCGFYTTQRCWKCYLKIECSIQMRRKQEALLTPIDTCIMGNITGLTQFDIISLIM